MQSNFVSTGGRILLSANSVHVWHKNARLEVDAESSGFGTAQNKC